MPDKPLEQIQPAWTTNADVIRGAIRFLRTVRLRKNYLLATFVLVALLGGIHYAMATRTYRATASLMVLQAGGEAWDPSLARDIPQQDLLPTFEKLFFQSVVVDEALRRISELPQVQQLDFEPYPPEEWPQVLRDNLDSRTIRQTKLIELSYCSRSPRAAEAILGAIVDAYLDFIDRTHHDVSVEIVSLLNAERSEIADELSNKQKQFRDLSRQAESFGLQDHETVVHPAVERVVELNRTLTEVRKERLQLEASLAAIQSARRNGQDLRPHLVSLEPIVGRELVLGAMGLDAESKEAANAVAESLREDRARLQTLLGFYGERHPEITQLRQQITDSESYLAEQRSLREQAGRHGGAGLAEMLISLANGRLTETRNYERDLLMQYQSATAEAAALEDQMVELSLIEHDIELLRNLHDTLANRIADLGIWQNKSDVRIEPVSRPAALDDPVAPRLSFVIVGCLVAGLGAGLLTVYIVDLLDDRFRSPAEIGEQLCLPVLGVIHRLAPFSNSGIDAIQVHVAPEAIQSESFHTLRTTLALTSDEHPCVAITSSEPGDGKTTVLANLAVSIAGAGRRVLLIDADMRRPGLRRLFGLPSTEGLSDLLRSRDDIRKCCTERVRSTGIERLDILPPGPKPADPAELLGSSRFADLLGWAEAEYDSVLVDCPPALIGGDAAIVGRATDNMLLLVHPETNRRHIVVRAAESLLGLKVRIAGIVVNSTTDVEHDEYYGYAGYGYTDPSRDFTDGDFPDEIEGSRHTSNRPRAA